MQEANRVVHAHTRGTLIFEKTAGTGQTAVESHIEVNRLILMAMTYSGVHDLQRLRGWGGEWGGG